MLITKTSDLPPHSHSPASLQQLTELIESGAQVAAVLMLIQLLKVHTDPMVQGIARLLDDTCVTPWTKGVLGEHNLVPTASNEYDLVLPAEGDVSIGSTETDDVQITVDNVAWRHVDIECREGEESFVWVASLSRAFGNDFGTVVMKVGDKEVSRNTRGREEYPDPTAIQVEPGDVIEIGLNKITLHAPTA